MSAPAWRSPGRRRGEVRPPVGEHYMQVSQLLGHANYSITLNMYGGYIPQDEGGKAAPLPAPVAPARRSGRPPRALPNNVIDLASRRRSAG